MGGVEVAVFIGSREIETVRPIEKENEKERGGRLPAQRERRRELLCNPFGKRGHAITRQASRFYIQGVLKADQQSLV